MNAALPQPVRLALWGWFATVLTSLAFFPALADKSFMTEGAFFAGCAVIVGILLRAARTPALVVFVVQLVAVCWLLVIRFGTHLWHGVIPTSETWTGLRTMISDGFQVAQQYPAPAPSNPGLLLMTVFAICVAAVFVDLLAVGLGRVPLAGLPLLALYTVPVAALPNGVTFIAFVPGAAAYIAMITSDERDRLVHWGRLVSRNTDGREPTTVDTSGLHATGRQVSSIALVVAVMIPALLPAISGSLLDATRSGLSGGGTGGSTLSFKDPMVSLADSLKRTGTTDLFHVTGPGDPDYIRLVVLTQPGADAWTSADSDRTATVGLTGTLPEDSALSDAVSRRTKPITITLMNGFPNDSRYLPVPYIARKVNVRAPFGYVPADQTVVATEPNAIDEVTSYRVTFEKPVPTADQLKVAGPPPADIADQFEYVPPGVPQSVRDQTHALTDAKATPYEKAVALEDYFRSGQFHYDTSVGYGDGYAAMGAFLDQKHGFCQQFAATMAMMARIAGIPSRIAVGFLSPTDADNTGLIVTSQDFHAWPELYFSGVGWVRFEPTPGRNAPIPDWVKLKDDGTVTSFHTRSSPSSSASATPTEHKTVGAPAAAGGSSGPTPPVPPRGLLIFVAVVLIALLPAALRRGVRQARLGRPLDPASAAEAAWLEVRDHVRDLRLPWSGSMTPRARERSLTPLLTGDSNGLGALHRLAMSVERARYAPVLDSGTATAPADARALMTAISRQADSGQRIRAFLWPTSLMPDIRGWWAGVTGRRHRHEG